MYPKNSASPPPIKAKVPDTDGILLESGVVAYHYTGTSRTDGSGTLTCVSGVWNYQPTQAECNYNEFAIEFYHASALANGPVVDVITDQGYGSSIESILDSTNTNGVIVAPASKTGYTLASDGLDLVIVESGINARQSLSIIASAAAGVLVGADGNSITISAAGVPATTRISADVDDDGNRTSVVLNLP